MDVNEDTIEKLQREQRRAIADTVLLLSDRAWIRGWIIGFASGVAVAILVYALVKNLWGFWE